VAGDSRAAETRALLRALQRPYQPRKVMLLRPTEERSPAICRLAPFTSYQTGIAGRAAAYICQDFHCQLPTTSAEEALALLGV